MASSVAPYEQLVRQVEALKAENSHLRQELRDNSSHLSKLETETSGMKEVLKHLQGKLEQEARVLVSSGQTEVLEQLKALQMDITSLYNLKFQAPTLGPELDREREWAWEPSLGQLLLPHVASLPVSSPADLCWSAERMGDQIRASRLEQIDKELLEAQDRVQQTEPQALLAVKSVPVDEDPETEVPTHPEDGTPQPGNSKVEVVFWLLSMLATRDQEDTARTLLAMSSSPESCVAMRRSGCLPLLLQILHGTDVAAGGRAGAPGAPGAKDARMRANAALHNIVFSQPDQGLARKEMRVLHVLEQIRAYCETCWDWLQARDGGPEGGGNGSAPIPIEPQICQATCAVMKLSFDEEYRRAMNELGGLQAVAELLQVDYEMHKMTRDPLNLALRRYAGMTLTNLTFGDVANKATLCARRGCMEAIVAQLASDSEELHQVVSSILRNLSWRADINSKKVLREAGSVTALVQCVLRATKESTLKSVLSALWNLSAHSTDNKAAICQVDGALGFLVSTLTYKCQSNSLAIIESGGGILRNVSSLIATREDYRQVLRDHNCLQTLLQHLTSHSLTIVSNACGTLWNLSARSARDQELLWDLGAVGMLRNLVHSKHKMIAMGSAAALRNLLAHRPAKHQAAATAVSPGSCQRALEAELDARHLAQALEHLEKQVARIDQLVEDISALHTSSDDSFSLSSGDPGQEAPREGRAQSCSPCRGPEGGRREAGSRAHPLLRLKAAQASLSNDSLNSGSASDGYCPREHMLPCPLAALASRREDPRCGQPRPSRLDLDLPGSQAEPPAREATSADARVRTIKLSPTYQHVPLLEGASRAGAEPLAGPGTSPGARKQAWLPADHLSKVPEKLVAAPLSVASKALQKLVAQEGPLSLSRCSSLSSLSSAGRPGPSEGGDLDDSDSSLEGLEEAGPGEAELDSAWRAPGATSLPVAIPAPRRNRGRGLGVEDATPSSSSENYVQETPLVLSRCSSVSSLGSFESPSIASSIPSDPCSGQGSGTISPSELPDSPGQTMPPSRSKTPPLAPAPQGAPEASQFSLQWESYVKRFLDIADCRERCRLPSELDAGSVRFTVEKPDENFSCASSLSALALHEHYVQQDVELRLLPSACPERGGGAGLHFAGHRRREEGPAPTGSRPRGAADQELELLRECLGAAVPARLRKVASALMPGRRALPVPVYMLVPAPAPAPALEDDSCTDSAEGTPVNFSSAASLSDETLQGPPRDQPEGPAGRQRPTGRPTSARQAVGHRHKAGGAGRSAEQSQGAGKNRAGLELPLGRPPSAPADKDGSKPGRTRGDGALQSLCLTTPTEEAVYCFYGNDSDEEPPAAAPTPTHRRTSAIPRAFRRERPQGRKEAPAPSKAAPAAPPPARTQPSLIADETPPCYSLSSSASSLSEPEPSEPPAVHPRGREPAVTKDPGPGGGRDSSPSPRAAEELLQRCISSALPRRRPPVSSLRRRKPRALFESDSILSFVSGLSVGSTLQPPKHRKGRQAEGEIGSARRPEKRGAASAKTSGSPRSPAGPEKPRGTQKTTPGVPAVLRGRTVIYVPSPAPRAQPKGTPGPRATPRKVAPPCLAQPAAPAKVPSPGQQRSRSLHRPGKTTELATLSQPPRSATPPARLAKTPSSSSSQTSPASQPLPRKRPPVTQAAGPLPGPGASPVPKTPARTLLAKQHKTQRSPVRIPFMQRPARRGPPPLARAVPEQGPRGRAGTEAGPGARGGRLGLVRVASALSSGSESSDRSGFRRQLTFIKESPGLRRRRSELSSAASAASAPQGASPRRGRPALPAVFLCSSRCEELRAAPRQAPARQRPPAARPGPGERPARRTSSESPSRLPVRAPVARPETVKRYASLPHISVARRPDGAVPAAPAPADAGRRSSDGEPRPLPRVAAPGTTWRRIR
uniref:APC regulator of WNT signaling pathway 2 n=1 Tax=Nomascus leucogenys TaxID=61853 RepID=G1QM25_NOMLE